MREFKHYLLSLLLLSVVISGFVFLRFAPGYPFPMGPEFDPHIRQKYRERLERERPQVLVLGDSVVDTNVDTGLMEDQLGKRVSAISEPGAGSALLYLILKNNILPAESRPEVIVLLFRDTVLTTPGFRVHGTFFEVMDEYGGAEDDLTLDLAIRARMSPLEKIAEAYLPPYAARWQLRSLLVSRLINFPARTLLACRQDCTEAAMGDVFGNQNFETDQLNEAINSAENFLYTNANLNFEGQVNRSFLPHMLQLAAENDIKLVLVRTKILRFTRMNPEPPGLVRYIHDLNAYADNHRVPLIDLAYEPDLQPALFEDMHHLNEDGKQVFTGLLVEALRTISLP